MFRIEVLGFPAVPRADAIAGLRRAFGLSEARATGWVSRAPTKVKSSVSETDAKRFIKALLSAGADVVAIDNDSGARHEFRAADHATTPAGGDAPIHLPPPRDSFVEREFERELPALPGSADALQTSSEPDSTDEWTMDFDEVDLEEPF